LTDAGFARVEALVEPANTASQRVVETVGFHREGVLRSHRVSGDHRSDMVSYSLITSDLG
jgi:[ribosomal protein S5]-alanine N-acetyltransferase